MKVKTRRQYMLTALKFGDYNNLFLLCVTKIFFSSVLCDFQKLVSLKAMSRSCFRFSRCPEGVFALCNVQKINFEGKSCTGRNDITNTFSSVSHAGRDRQFSGFSDAHSNNSIIPALNHLSDSGSEIEWLVPVLGGVELATVQ